MRGTLTNCLGTGAPWPTRHLPHHAWLGRLRCAVRTLGRQVGRGLFEVGDDLGPNFIRRRTWLRILRRRQRTRHERHTAKRGDEVEVPVGTQELRLSEVRELGELVHLDARNVLQGEVAVRDAFVGCLPLPEHNAARRIAVKALKLEQVGLVGVAGTTFVGIVADNVTEVPTEVRTV